MRIKKIIIAAVAIFYMVSFANGELTLTVNGLDASNSVEIEPNVAIIISVTGANDTNENYSVICETGGTLEMLQEPNAASRNSYVFTFEEQEAGLAAVNLTTNNIFDYQFILFTIPHTNVVVVGIDADAIPLPEPELQASVSQAALPAPGGGGTIYTMGAMDCNEVLDPNFFPNLNNDSFVNFVDFAIFAENWLASGASLDGDFNGSERVDYYDLKYLSYFWLASACSPAPEDIFDAFKNALATGDIDKALTFVAQASRDEYAQIFQIIEPNLPEYVAGMGELTLESEDEGTAKYEMVHQSGSETYLFPVIFIKNDKGVWQIFKL